MTTIRQKEFNNCNDVWDRRKLKLVILVVSAQNVVCALSSVRITLDKQLVESKKRAANQEGTVPINELFLLPLQQTKSLYINIALVGKKKTSIVGEAEVLVSSLNMELVDERVVELRVTASGRGGSRRGGKKKAALSLSNPMTITLRMTMSNHASTRSPAKPFKYSYDGLMLKTGDLVAYQTFGLMSSLTRVLRNTIYNHIGIILVLPNKYTNHPELYVCEVVQDPDKMLDAFKEMPKEGGPCIFRLFERIHGVHGGNVTLIPLRNQLTPEGATKMIEWIWKQHALPGFLLNKYMDSEEMKFVADTFPRWKIKDDQHFQQQFNSLLSPQFVARCLQYAGVVADDTRIHSIPELMQLEIFEGHMPLRVWEPAEAHQDATGAAILPGTDSAPRPQMPGQLSRQESNVSARNMAPQTASSYLGPSQTPEQSQPPLPTLPAQQTPQAPPRETAQQPPLPTLPEDGVESGESSEEIIIGAGEEPQEEQDTSQVDDSDEPAFHEESFNPFGAPKAKQRGEAPSGPPSFDPFNSAPPAAPVEEEKEVEVSGFGGTGAAFPTLRNVSEQTKNASIIRDVLNYYSPEELSQISKGSITVEQATALATSRPYIQFTAVVAKIKELGIPIDVFASLVDNLLIAPEVLSLLAVQVSETVKKIDASNGWDKIIELVKTAKTFVHISVQTWLSDARGKQFAQVICDLMDANETLECRIICDSSSVVAQSSSDSFVTTSISLMGAGCAIQYYGQHEHVEKSDLVELGVPNEYVTLNDYEMPPVNGRNFIVIDGLITILGEFSISDAPLDTNAITIIQDCAMTSFVSRIFASGWIIVEGEAFAVYSEKYNPPLDSIETGTLRLGLLVGYGNPKLDRYPVDPEKLTIKFIQ